MYGMLVLNICLLRSDYFKRMDLLSLLRLSEFHSILASAGEFRKWNREGYNSIFRINFEESQDKENRHKRPQRQYEISNIAENLKTPNKRTYSLKNGAGTIETVSVGQEQLQVGITVTPRGAKAWNQKSHQTIPMVKMRH
jgi:hypothetical protein